MHPISETERLNDAYYGYSLRAHTTLKMKTFGVSNFLVILALSYLATLMVSNGIKQIYVKFSHNRDTLNSKINF